MNNKEERILFLIGIGMGTRETITQEAQEAIASCGCLIGAPRVVEPFLDAKKKVICAYKPEEIRAYIESNWEELRIAVLLSGDAGFYSGAKKIREALRDLPGSIAVLPGISSVVYLAARLQTSWEDGALMSLHGTRQNVIYEVLHHRKTFVLLGSAQEAGELCEKLHYYGLDWLRVSIGRDLSYEAESIVTKQAGALKPEDLGGLAVILIENERPDNFLCPNIQDEAFLRGDVPMTKEEVRSISIAKLCLKQQSVLYDIGAGTGSVGIQAALQSGSLQVFAIEKNEKALELLEANKRKFCADQLTIVKGTAPEALEALPAPTHVFIGGSGGCLREIVRLVQAKNKEARIVLNAISLETLSEVTELAREGILSAEHLSITQVSVSKSKTAGKFHMMTSQNPIYIIAC